MCRWISLLLLWAAFAASAQEDAIFKKLDFLLGDWVGVAGANQTPQGAGQGAFSFRAELGGKIIVRKNEARYNSGPNHDDLMVIYLEDGPRAIYFDSEGHTIHYQLSFPAAGSAVFDSGQYRLTYWQEKGVLKGKFEVGGKVYMTWDSRKR